jgi:hypothetical protein
MNDPANFDKEALEQDILNDIDLLNLSENDEMEEDEEEEMEDSKSEEQNQPEKSAQQNQENRNTSTQNAVQNTNRLHERLTQNIVSEQNKSQTYEFIVTFEGKIYLIELPKTATVYDLKQAIFKVVQVLPEHQQIHGLRGVSKELLRDEVFK